MPYVSPVDLPSLIAEVRAVLNEPSQVMFSDAEITAWLNQGALDCSAKSGCIEAIGTVALAASTIEYAIPTTFATPTIGATGYLVKVYAALLGNLALTKVHPRMFLHMTAIGTADSPVYWALFGKRIFFYPVGTGISGTVRLLCEVATTDPMDLPEAWKPLTILFAASRAKIKDYRMAEAAALYAEYTSTLIYQRRDLLERAPSSKAEVTIPDNVVMMSQQAA